MKKPIKLVYNPLCPLEKALALRLQTIVGLYGVTLELVRASEKAEVHLVLDGRQIGYDCCMYGEAASEVSAAPQLAAVCAIAIGLGMLQSVSETQPSTPI